MEINSDVMRTFVTQLGTYPEDIPHSVRIVRVGYLETQLQHVGKFWPLWRRAYTCIFSALRATLCYYRCM